MTLWRALFLVAVGATRAASGASRCASAQGRAAPSVTTLFAAPNNTTNAAWVLQPNCALEVIEIAPANNGVPMLNCFARGIQRVESIPTKTELLRLEYNPVTEVDLANATNLYQLILAWCDLKSVDTFKFPPSLGIFDFDGNNLQGLAKSVIPAKVNTMYLTGNKLASLTNFALPTFLTALHLERNNFTSLNFTIPAGLVELHIDANEALKTIENVSMPDSLTKFTCTECAIETFRGVQLSTNLASIDIRGSTLTELEIRELDVDILKKLEFSGNIAQTTCRNANAAPRRVKSTVVACVISDTIFEMEYRNGKPQPSPTTASGSSDASKTAPPTISPTLSTPPSAPPSSSSSSTTIIVIGVVACVASVVCGVFLYRKCARGTDTDHRVDNKYHDATTLDDSTAVPTPATRSSEYLTNDIRNDEALISYRIAYEDVQIVKVIGKGGFGIVHLGKFRGREVAVKQILPDKAKDIPVLHSFMDEIRLCASLEHPHIVEFIGLRWSTLQDVAVINEYMAGGDLQVVLQKQEYSDPAQWFEPSVSLKAKSALALDVIVALVY